MQEYCSASTTGLAFSIVLFSHFLGNICVVRLCGFHAGAEVATLKDFRAKQLQNLVKQHPGVHAFVHESLHCQSVFSVPSKRSK